MRLAKRNRTHGVITRRSNMNMADIDYIHINPLKHGLVSNVKDWPYSSFHRYVADGIYSMNWCGDEPIRQQHMINMRAITLR